MYMKQLAVYLAVGALALSACSKDVEPSDEGDTPAGDEGTETDEGGDKGDEASTTNESDSTSTADERYR